MWVGAPLGPELAALQRGREVGGDTDAAAGSGMREWLIRWCPRPKAENAQILKTGHMLGCGSILRTPLPLLQC